MADLTELSLPLKSIYHYITYDGISIGPEPDEYVFRSVTKPINIHNVTDVGDYKGAPRKVAANEPALMRELINKNRRLRPLKSLEVAAKDPQTLVVYNYCLILKTHRYVRGVFTEYYKWYNAFSAVLKTAADVASKVDNQQYLVCGIPRIIPSVSQLNDASKNLTQPLLKVFKDSNSFIVLELWKWLSGDDSLQSVFLNIPKDKLHCFNLIYQETGRWTVLNLGYLDSFRKDNKADENASDGLAKPGNGIQSSAQLSGEQIQKRFLRFLMKVMESRTATANTSSEEDEVADKAIGKAVQDDTDESEVAGNDDDNDDDSAPSSIMGNKPTPEPTQPLEVIDVESDEDDDKPETQEQAALRMAEEEKILDRELAQLNDIAHKQENSHIPVASDLNSFMQIPDPSLDRGVMDVCDRLADDGLLTAGEYRRYDKLSQSYKSLESPYGGGATLEELITVKPEDLLIKPRQHFKDSPTVLDKSMLRSSLEDFDTSYISQVLPKHTAGMVTHIQKAGIALTEYSIDRREDILGAFEDHTIKLVPVEGAPSTLKFKIPVINEDGTFTANGVNYRMRKQRGDLPIRKVSAARVALTSYYGKAFVKRGRKRSHDYGSWLCNRIIAKGLDKSDQDITDLVPSNCFDSTLKAHRSYTAAAVSVRTLTARGYSVYFDQTLIKTSVPEALRLSQEKLGNLVIGFNGQNYLIMDSLGSIYSYNDNEMLTLGSLEQFLNIPVDFAPVEFAEVTVFGTEIPVGLVLSYFMGFTNLLKLLKVEPRRIEAGKRVTLGFNEYSLVFSDETLVFSRDDRIAALVLGGFRDYHRPLRLFSVYSFDKRGVYLNILESNKIGVRYLREVDLMNQMFIDPITKQLLEQMKEPQTFQGLLVRSCEMLISDEHPDELDPKFMRIKGYERVPGAIYTELIQSLRAHNGSLGKSNKRIEMNPYSVWKRITEDPAKSQISEINPIKSLKEMEAVTYAGEGGRNKRSMTKNTRVYHPNDMGVISESTVDSSDVAINVYMSANPKLNSVLGLASGFDLEKDGSASLLSTSALLAPGSDKDDPKRVNFVGIQQEHCVACDGYHQTTIRTGYEEIVAQRTGPLFAYTAKKPGKVLSIDDKGIIVEYTDGKVQGYELGRRYGNAAGLTIPHHIVTPLKVGSDFIEGDAIVYNTGFFEADAFNPKRIIMKNSMNVKTVLWESTQTLEDASSISPRVAEKMKTRTTKIKHITVTFDESITKLVKEGDKVDYDTVLCIIQDQVTSNAGLFDEDTIDTLRIVGSQTPRAGVKGVVERVEVYYHGDLEDMSESLQALAKASDKQFKIRAKSMNKTVFTGSVDSSFRIDGNPLGLDCLDIKIYITSNAPAGVGDKGVFCNQMKTVFSEVIEGDYVTEEGVVIDAIFGAQSIDKRIVNSPPLIGTTNTLLEVIAKRAVEAYYS